MSVNNFKLVRDLLEFRSEDDFYFLQIIQRKKDAHDGQKVNGTNNNSRLVKAYYVKSLEHFDFIEKEVKVLCEVFNARAGINLNRRSFESMALQHLKKVTDQIINKDYKKAYKAYSSVVGAFSQDSDKKWIIDIDSVDIEQGLDVNKMCSFIDIIQPHGETKFIEKIPSKSGFHIITKPFNRQEFKKEYPQIEVHGNNPTNLFIP